MRIVAKGTLMFWDHPANGDAQGPRESWYEEALKATWLSPQAVKDQ